MFVKPAILRTIYLLTFAVLIFLILPSCEDNIIYINKFCDEYADLDFNSVIFTIHSDITVGRTINITPDGRFSCDGISVKSGDYLKTAEFQGAVCKGKTAWINVNYLDTNDNSSLRIEAKDSLTYLTGKIFYCPDKSNCSYIQIGRILGFNTGSYEGFFYTPLVNGYFTIIINNSGKKK